MSVDHNSAVAGEGEEVNVEISDDYDYDEEDQDFEEDQEDDDDDDQQQQQQPQQLQPQRQERLPGCDDVLTEDEIEWARDLAAIVEGLEGEEGEMIGRGGGGGGDGTIPLLDFDYVVFGLFSLRTRNANDTIRRMKGMELFRNYYNIQDTPDECVEYIEQFIHLQPGVLLYLDNLCGGSTNEGILVWDQSKLFPSRALNTPTEKEFRISVVTSYYLTTIIQPTLVACRNGTHTLVETNNLGWDNYNQEYDSRLSEQLFQHYPETMSSMKFYNSNTITNLWLAFFRRSMPREQQVGVQLGCQIEYSNDGNPNNPKLLLTDLYIQPTYEIAMERILQRAKELAIIRFYNQQHFRLPPPSPEQGPPPPPPGGAP